MSNFDPSELSLSYKELHKLLDNAPKEKGLPSDPENKDKLSKEFLNELLIKWTSISEELLKELKQKDSKALTNSNPKSLMALGALESHLFLAIQAKEASGLI